MAVSRHPALGRRSLRYCFSGSGQSKTEYFFSSPLSRANWDINGEVNTISKEKYCECPGPEALDDGALCVNSRLLLGAKISTTKAIYMPSRHSV